jgi:DNA-binding NtrC family response regulator
MNVLVVDDEAEIVEEVCGFLRRRGFEPIAANGVEAARSALEGQSQVDIVLTDMRMPPGSGLEVLKASVAHASRPAMLVMTGQATDEETREALRVGAASILPKPLSLRAVLEALRKIERDRGTA